MLSIELARAEMLPRLAPGSKRYGQTRSRILAVARKILRDQPIEACSIEGIAQAANVTRRTIYNHFPSVSCLFEAVCEQTLLDLSKCIDTDIDLEADPEAALRCFAARTAALLRDDRHIELLHVMMRNARHCDGLMDEYRRRVRKPLEQAAELYFLRQRMNGRLVRDDPTATAAEFLALIEASAVPPRMPGVTFVPAGELGDRILPQVVAAFTEVCFLPEPRAAARQA
jgi:AcrR family transcriptional regulator